MSRRAEPLPTEHDLPPKWDGRVVWWKGWRDSLVVTICPPPKTPERCEQCRSTAAQQINTGFVAHKLRTTLEQMQAADQHHKVGTYGVIRLFAWRCPDCRLDTVHDLLTGDAWVLDGTDYGDAGSNNPEGPFA